VPTLDRIFARGLVETSMTAIRFSPRRYCES
jgi:hypothetical protein